MYSDIPWDEAATRAKRDAMFREKLGLPEPVQEETLTWHGNDRRVTTPVSVSVSVTPSAPLYSIQYLSLAPPAAVVPKGYRTPIAGDVVDFGGSIFTLSCPATLPLTWVTVCGLPLYCPIADYGRTWTFKKLAYREPQIYDEVMFPVAIGTAQGPYMVTRVDTFANGNPNEYTVQHLQIATITYTGTMEERAYGINWELVP